MSTTTRGAALALLGTLALLAAPAAASASTLASATPAGGPGGTCPAHTIANPAPAPFANFGKSVAVDGGRVLVGAPTDRFLAAGPGAAHLFTVPGGRLQRTFDNPTPAERDEFGWAVAIEGDVAVVAAPLDDTAAADAGAVYVYRAGSGRLRLTLADTAPTAGDDLGRSVATDGRHVLVGAPGDDNGGVDGSGAAHLFDARTGRLVRTFTNPVPTLHAGFGASVAIDGDRVLVGARGTGVTQDGAAHLFDLRSGRVLASFVNPTPQDGVNETFGLGVALSGHRALIGTRGDRNAGEDLSGAAYLFETRQGDLVATILNPTPAAVDFFGHAVALNDRWALIGAPIDDTGGAASGAVHLYRRGDDTPALSLAGAAGDGLGDAVALGHHTAVVGAPTSGGGTGVEQAGAVIWFRTGC